MTENASRIALINRKMDEAKMERDRYQSEIEWDIESKLKQMAELIGKEATASYIGTLVGKMNQI